MPHSERPRERCLKHGSECLSLRECLAVILGTGPPQQGSLGVARAILSRNGHSNPKCQEEAFFEAMETSCAALETIQGLGAAGIARLKCTFEIARRYSLYKAPPPLAPTRTSIRRVMKRIPRAAFVATQEWLGFVIVSQAGQLGNLCIVARGGRGALAFTPADLFGPLLSLRPLGFYLFHNHPSGRLSPSNQDRQTTQQVRDLSEVFDLRFLGHWILSRNGHTRVT